MGSPTSNLSTREVETGVMWLGRERNIRQEETGAHYRLRFGGEITKREKKSEMSEGSCFGIILLYTVKICHLN